MVFSSYTFLFYFLPPLLILYYLIPRRSLGGRNLVLLAFSLFFYFAGGPRHLPLMLLSIAINYVGGLLCAKRRRWALVLTMAVNLGLLGWFKYAGFVGENLRALGLPLSVPEVVLPIGISFFTFQGMSYVIDVYRGDTPPAKNPLQVALYIALFPQLVAGPIVRYTTVAEELVSRRETFDDFAAGALRFSFGLAKKMLLANNLSLMADEAFSTAPIGAAAAWLGAIAYTGQIYFDFSGYSDMAIGLGRMFGFQFLENFQYPYISSSIKEFWRRWHISLSSWFRDYLYIPLGGNRKGKVRTELNKAVVFFCTGLWHGASWNFVLWGLWHGVFIILEDLLPKGGKVRKALGHVTTLLIVLLGFVLFRADTLESAGLMFSQMFTGFAFTLQSDALLRDLLTPLNLATVALGVLCSLPLLPWVRYKAQGDGKGALALRVGSYALSAGLYLLCVMNLAGSAFNPFIYFRF